MTDQTTNQDQLFENSIGSTEVSTYKFEPIKGFPMLTWKGKRPFKSTSYYPAQLKEVYGEDVDGWRNKLYWGDNLQVMSHLIKEFRGKIDLIYIDPPFDSKADYKKKITLRGKVVTNEHTSFEDKQYSDIWTNDEYLQFMYERLTLLRELLSETGSIYVHMDEKRSHYIKVIMDEVFGQSSFRREIIWSLAGVSGYKSLVNNFVRGHDTILYYSKSQNVLFNKAYLPYTEAQLKRFVPDENGRLYKSITKDRGIYLDEANGIPVSDVWSDIASFQTVVNSPEIANYPTQKPEKLIERIIIASSNPGDLVLDCFMGSGTTQAVALKLGRRFIGADINVGAIQTTTKRLFSVLNDIQNVPTQSSLLEGDEKIEKLFTGFEVYNVNNYDVFRNPVEAKDILISALELHRFESGNLYDGEKDGRLYKIMPVNRITTRSDLNELITGFDYKAFDRRLSQNPSKVVEKITLVCMGHEPDLAAELITEVKPYNIDVEVLDILRDKQDLQFKRDSEAKLSVRDGYLHIDAFYPMNLLQKLSLQKDNVENWREMVESIMVDWNYDGAVLQPSVVDIPEKNELVIGKYRIPPTAGTIRVKITDLLSESLEIEVSYG